MRLLRHLLPLLFCQSIPAIVPAQSGEVEAPIRALVENFQQAIATKDSTTFTQLFFHDKVAFIGIMSRASEASIQAKNPGFEGVSVSNCTRFIREICVSPAQKEERMDNITSQISGGVGTVSFNYQFLSDGNLEQWGREHWNLAFADGTWLITDVVYSVHLPSAEPTPH